MTQAQRFYKAFDSISCDCCKQPSRHHPYWGIFCYKNNKQVKCEKRVARDETKFELRDGTFVLEFHVKKKWLEDQKKKNKDLKHVALLMYYVMDVSLYYQDQKKIAMAALKDFVYHNVKYLFSQENVHVTKLFFLRLFSRANVHVTTIVFFVLVSTNP